MPNYAYFYDKKTGNRKDYLELDAELCAVVGEPCDPNEWCRNWYNVIAFQIAVGDKLTDIRRKFESGEWGEDAMERFGAILDHLEANYTTDAFAMRG